MKDEIISAFAFRTAKAIEQMIDVRTNALEEHNQRLSALILSYRQSITDPEQLAMFDQHFYITSHY